MVYKNEAPLDIASTRRLKAAGTRVIEFVV
jgi:hypothetical protein